MGLTIQGQENVNKLAQHQQTPKKGVQEQTRGEHEHYIILHTPLVS